MSPLQQPPMGQKAGIETVRCLKDQLKDSDFASTAKLIEMIRDLSRGYDDTGVEQLAGLISGDAGFAIKVIKAAQPMRYNPEGIQVENITQAIHIVGLNKIRTVSISLLVGEDPLDAFGKKSNNEANTAALCSAMMSRYAAVKARFSDPNLCFVSGLLQHYGAILGAKFHSEKYLQTRIMEVNKPYEEAFEETFGISQLDLSREILKWQKMPTSLIKVLREPTKLEIKNAHPSAELQPLIAGSFGRLASRVISQPNLTRFEFEKKIQQYLARYSHSIGIDMDDFHHCLLTIQDEIKQFKLSGEGNGFSEAILKRIKILASDNEEEPPITEIGKILKSKSVSIKSEEPDKTHEAPETISIETATTETETPNIISKPNLESSRLVYSKSIEDLSVLAEMESTTAEQIGTQGLDVAMNVHKAETAMLFFLDPAKESLQLKAGIGKLDFDQELIKPIRFNEKNIFSVCLEKQQSIFLENPNEMKESDGFPDWLKPLQEMKPFILTPLQFTYNKVGVMFMAGGGSESFNEYQTSSQETMKFSQVVAHLILKKNQIKRVQRFDKAAA